jgi:chromosome partitioning protein
MAKVLSFINQKGGVGKTTSAVNVSACLGAMGKRVLMIDLDPQGSASEGYGIDIENLDITVKDVLLDLDLPPQSAILRTEVENVSVIPANIILAEADIELMNATKREERLVSAIKPLKDQYDYIVIDSPPSLSMLTINAMTASEFVFIPVQAGYYAFKGVKQLLRTFTMVRRLLNENVVIGGVFVTIAGTRENITKLSVKKTRELFGDAAMQTLIRRNVSVTESPGSGKPVVYTDPSSIGAIDYKELTLEIVARCEQVEQE